MTLLPEKEVQLCPNHTASAPSLEESLPTPEPIGTKREIDMEGSFQYGALIY